MYFHLILISVIYSNFPSALALLFCMYRNLVINIFNCRSMLHECINNTVESTIEHVGGGYISIN
jgi:hypothetical protein